MMDIIRDFSDILGLMGVLIGGLIFVWRVSTNLNTTLSNLNGSTTRLNEHLSKLEVEVNDLDETLANHETRITVLEKLRDKE